MIVKGVGDPEYLREGIFINTVKGSFVSHQPQRAPSVQRSRHVVFIANGSHFYQESARNLLVILILECRNRHSRCIACRSSSGRDTVHSRETLSERG